MPKYHELPLPLPPAADNGVVNGQFVQVDYGFGFPVPPKWNYLWLSADQEVDEVARFSDPTKQMVARLSVQILNSSQSFSAKTWAANTEQDLKNRLFQITSVGKMLEWKTGDGERWFTIPYRVVDISKKQWLDEECALNKGDMLLLVHATLPRKLADSAQGNKLMTSLEESLMSLHWYTPIGARGISVERFELQNFTEGFCRVLESRNFDKINAYFDEMYPERAQFENWYRKAVSGDPKMFDLQTELSGLVINGDYATATFALVLKEKGGSHVQKAERSFKLSKKEGAWKIVESIEKN